MLTAWEARFVGQMVENDVEAEKARREAAGTAGLTQPPIPPQSASAAAAVLLPLAKVVWASSDRLSGAPCFTGSRVPVKALFDYLEGGDSLDTFLDDFEGVTRQQAVSALYYGKARLMPPGSPQPTGNTHTVPDPVFL